MVTDSLSQDPTLDSIGQTDPVDEQQPFADQQPQAMQDCSKILATTYAIAQPREGVAEQSSQQPSQQPSQQALSSSSHNPATAPWSNEDTMAEPSRTEYMAQPSYTSPSVPEVIGSFHQQNLAKHVVASIPSSTHGTRPMDPQYCSISYLTSDSNQTQTNRSEVIATTPQWASNGQTLIHASFPVVSKPVYGCFASWPDIPQQPGTGTPLEWTENRHSRDDCYRGYGVAAVSTPQTTTANITWFRAHFEGPEEVDNGSMFSDVGVPVNDQTLHCSDGSILVDSSVAVVGVDTSLHQTHIEGNSQGADVPLGQTSMIAFANVRQRILF
ncbi:hypothetical protein CI238_13157 [Colletotrichum incanum]|uniref:Uncharacterized protein n=1 Tax=Colletotrichum incanum TaxID=1573173 RepID=A0A161W0F4_COLIC|nr:hypothetical protein CI238_13157 [Colletotrichum incanum]